LHAQVVEQRRDAAHSSLPSKKVGATMRQPLTGGQPVGLLVRALRMKSEKVILGQ
jgi:hypothetical protein